MIIATIAIIIIIIIIKQRVKRYSKPSTLFEHYRQQLLLLSSAPNRPRGKGRAAKSLTERHGEAQALAQHPALLPLSQLPLPVALLGWHEDGSREAALATELPNAPSVSPCLRPCGNLRWLLLPTATHCGCLKRPRAPCCPGYARGCRRRTPTDAQRDGALKTRTRTQALGATLRWVRG